MADRGQEMNKATDSTTGRKAALNAQAKVEQPCNLTAPLCRKKYDSIEHQGHCVEGISRAVEREKKKSSTKCQIRPGV